MGRPELGAVALAASASLASGLPFLIVRKEAKDYGTSNRIEGVYEPGECVCLVEDVVTSGGALSTPLGLAVAPNGDVLTVNGGNGKIVETTPAGHQIANRFLDRSGSPPGSGALFGLAVAPAGSGVYFVDDAVNTLDLLH